MIVIKNLEQETRKHQIKKPQEEHMDSVIKKNEQNIPIQQKVFSGVIVPTKEKENGEQVHLVKPLHDHELDKFVDTFYATNKRPEEVFNADIVVYKKLTQAVNNGRNIVYESTGVSFDTIKEIIKLANNACSSNRYNYIILGVVNIIDNKSNLERIQTRFKSDLEKFKENTNENPAPQFPSTPSLGSCD